MSQKHAHKYQRFSIGRNKWQVYKCMLPGCNSRISVDDIVGRDILCWRCGNEFVATLPLVVSKYTNHERVYRVKPVCCAKKIVIVTEDPEIMSDLLKKVGLE